MHHFDAEAGDPHFKKKNVQGLGQCVVDSKTRWETTGSSLSRLWAPRSRTVIHTCFTLTRSGSTAHTRYIRRRCLSRTCWCPHARSSPSHQAVERSSVAIVRVQLLRDVRLCHFFQPWITETFFVLHTFSTATSLTCCWRSSMPASTSRAEWMTEESNTTPAAGDYPAIDPRE